MSEYAPSPVDFVAKQVREYEASSGREANTMRGVPVIILTTTGRRSGMVRKTPLMRVEHDGSYAVVASKGGAPEHPVWYLNLREQQHAELQDGPAPRTFAVHVATGEERTTWWARATQVWPDYDDYQTKTDREIPLVVLEPLTP